MNQANQKAVVQEANMNLVEIRNVELDYFSTFYSNFATQAALMIGFIVGSLSQVPTIDNPSGAPYFFVVLYNITSATTLASAIHSLVCAVFVQVFGQGLGLRGPLGSMIISIEGMVVEQQQILVSFIITVSSFGLQCIGMYWIMMDQTNAIIATVITGLAMIVWYRYSLRLYNRFSWNSLRVDWQEEEDPEEELEDLNPSVINQLHNRKKESKQNKTALTAGSDKDNSQGVDLTVIGGESTSADIEKNATSGGYLTLKLSNIILGDPWKRRYFMLRGTSVYYYKDKRAFQLEPSKPLNQRPIDLDGYRLIANSKQPPYLLSLIPVEQDDIRKNWKFRTDTPTEYQQWIDIFSKALKKTETGLRLGGQVICLDSTGGNSSSNQDD
jgi:hypothetical protein